MSSKIMSTDPGGAQRLPLQMTPRRLLLIATLLLPRMGHTAAQTPQPPVWPDLLHAHLNQRIPDSSSPKEDQLSQVIGRGAPRANAPFVLLAADPRRRCVLLLLTPLLATAAAPGVQVELWYDWAGARNH